MGGATRGTLGHKGDPWNWQNSELLRGETGLGAHFFALHRDGVPFSNIMAVEHGGVGLLAHVWTREADRRSQPEKIAVLERVGFHRTTILPQWIEDFESEGAQLDVNLLIRKL